MDQDFWYFGLIRQEIKTTADAATGVADGRERGVIVDPESHVTGNVLNDCVEKCVDITTKHKIGRASCLVVISDYH